MFACLTAHRSLRYILPDRRICAQPPTVLRIEIPRTVVIQPGLFVLFLRSKRRNLAVASRVLLCKTRRKSILVPNMLFLQLKCHDFEPLLNCQRTKLQNISWEYLAENHLSNRVIIMQQCKIVKCFLLVFSIIGWYKSVLRKIIDMYFLLRSASKLQILYFLSQKIYSFHQFMCNYFCAIRF